MSVKATTWAWEAPAELNTTELLILVALADYADDTGRAWPSMARLARRCHVNRSTVHRNLKRLEELHRLITPVRSGGGRSGRTNIYQLQMKPPRYPAERRDEPAESVAAGPLLEGSQDATRVDNSPEPVAPVHRGGAVQPVALCNTPVAPDATGDVAPDATRPVSEPSITTTHARDAYADGSPEFVRCGDRLIEIPEQPHPERYRMDDADRARALNGVRAIKAQLAERGHGSEGDEL